MNDYDFWADLLLISRYLPAAISVLTLFVTVAILLKVVVRMCFERWR